MPASSRGSSARLTPGASIARDAPALALFVFFCPWLRRGTSDCPAQRYHVGYHADFDDFRVGPHADPGDLRVSPGVVNIPCVWASASDAVRSAAGIPNPSAATAPKLQNALRREINLLE